MPTHSKTTGAFGIVTPTFSRARHVCHHGTGSRAIVSIPSTAAPSAAGAVVRWPVDAAVVRRVLAGSTTTSAPQAVASARRPDDGSLATMVRTPRALSSDHHGQADRAAADHDRHVLAADLAAVDGVPAHRHRLGEHRDLVREPVRHPERQRLLHQHPLRVGARRAGRQPGRVHVGALAQQRQRDHRRAHRQVPLGPRAALDDLGHELVAEHDLLLGAHQVVVADLLHQVGETVGLCARVEVGAADAGASYLHEEVSGTRHRVGEVGDRQRAPGAGDCLHRAPPVRRVRSTYGRRRDQRTLSPPAVTEPPPE